MHYTYDPVLVMMSVIVAIVGAYTCFDLVIKIRGNNNFIIRKSLISAAFSIGGSIWSMHFVAMLAVNLTAEIRYDVLTTLISGLVSVLMTAAALIIISAAAYSARRTLVAGVVMGLGIVTMHYVGMAAIRGNFSIEYSKLWILLSILIGIAASSASLWSAIQLRGIWRRIIAALVMGVSIAGVHYTGMAGTSFSEVDNAFVFSHPILSQFSLGLLTTISTFVILGYTLLTLVPERFPEALQKDSATSTTRNQKNKDDADISLNRLPVQKNNKTYFIPLTDIVSITSDGHYTSVQTTQNESHFCNHSIGRVEKQLDPSSFIRVHRRHIINLQHVKSFERQHDKGLLLMQGNDKTISVSRKNISALAELLGL